MRISDWSSDVCSSDLIHGADAVVDVQPKANDKTPHAAEMDHLRKTYGDKVILALFPGHSPRIPVSLKDVGLDREGKQIGDIPPGNVPDDSTPALGGERSEEHTSELQSLMRTSYAVFC